MLASGQRGPAGIAVDATNVYWANLVDGTLLKMASGGGSPVVLASGVHTSYFAIDATNIYWTDSTGGKVIKAPLGGGAPVELAAGQPSATISPSTTRVSTGRSPARSGRVGRAR